MRRVRPSCGIAKFVLKMDTDAEAEDFLAAGFVDFQASTAPTYFASPESGTV